MFVIAVLVLLKAFLLFKDLFPILIIEVAPIFPEGRGRRLPE